MVSMKTIRNLLLSCVLVVMFLTHLVSRPCMVCQGHAAWEQWFITKLFPYLPPFLHWECCDNYDSSMLPEYSKRGLPYYMGIMGSDGEDIPISAIILLELPDDWSPEPPLPDHWDI